MESRDVLQSARDGYIKALRLAERMSEMLSAAYWMLQHKAEQIDECHDCREISDKGHTLLDEYIEGINRMAGVMERTEKELHAMIGDEA